MIFKRVRELQLALMMLTRLPAGNVCAPVPTLSEASWAFPFIGIIVGTVGWLVLTALVWSGVPTSVSILATMAATAFVTGALHHDGLADFADGIGGGKDRAQCLEIMRDSRIGSYGVIALIFAVGTQAAAMIESFASLTLLAFVFVGTASRFVMLVLLVCLPPARSDGLGSGASGSSWASLVPSALFLFVLAVLIGTPGLVVLLAMGLGAAIVAKIALRRIGGQTGDVLGAAQTIAEATGWVVFSSALI